MVKYKTREETLKAVIHDGNALADADARFRDDEKIVDVVWMLFGSEVKVVLKLLQRCLKVE